MPQKNTRPSTSSRFLHAALRYADLGYPVLPCVRGAKEPLTPHGMKDATTDREQIESWWAQNPHANIAVRTDGLLIVDVDGKDNSWIGDQDERWQGLAAAPSSQTPHGGRHFWFRQPSGKAWRCTQGRLADRVDTRANGGYIVAPPSSVDGRAYQWLQGYELAVPLDQLPEPPAWLVEQLDRIATTPAIVPAIYPLTEKIAEGRRNGTLTSLAGSMRRVGMTAPEIAAALHRVNADRCAPPLSDQEVDTIAASVARYAPDQVATAIADGRLGQMAETPIAQPLSTGDLMARYPALRQPVIRDLLRRGETMNVISLPKLGKSWLVLDLAVAITVGRSWLENFQTERGDVLILDNELHGETSANRIPEVASARGISLNAVADHLFVLNLRGQLKDVFSLRPFFESIVPGRYSVIILDAFYRFMPQDMDENDNGAMASVYNRIDSYADRLGCSFVLIHHATKGSQSAKSVTDVGAGAGSQSRATDTHLILRPHAETGAVVLEAAVRSWPPVLPIVLRWTFPVWTRAPELDPAALRDTKPKRPPKVDEGPPAEDDVAAFVAKFITETPQTKTKIIRAATKVMFSVRKANSLLRTAEEDELIHRWTYGSRMPVRFATVPKLPKEENKDDETIAPV